MEIASSSSAQATVIGGRIVFSSRAFTTNTGLSLRPSFAQSKMDPAVISICEPVTKLVFSVFCIQGLCSPVPGIARAGGGGLDFGAVAIFNFLKDRALDKLHRMATITT
jgi:hypothetical protein